tara:strand:+ start:33424 stop:34350 length:927 start_codon:yes stop_codon:yes gene_type:complete
MSIFVYNLEDFNSIKNKGFEYNLDSSILDIIQTISNQVGSPEYIKTPNFVKSKKIINDENWEKIIIKKPINTTKTKQELCIESIRININKITSKTYDNIILKIINDIENIENDEINSDCDNRALFNKIGEIIFVIASTNIFYSNIYAKLYNDLMVKFSFMNYILNENFEKFSDMYKNIEYCDSNIDYDKYCEINKNNDKRRALCMFYVNLMKLQVITKESIIKLILDIQNNVNDRINIETNKPFIDELSELIFILVTNSKSELSDQKQWDEISGNITSICKMEQSINVGLTNKSIFKHMDISDIISKN